MTNNFFFSSLLSFFFMIYNMHRWIYWARCAECSKRCRKQYKHFHALKKITRQTIWNSFIAIINKSILSHQMNNLIFERSANEIFEPNMDNRKWILFKNGELKITDNVLLNHKNINIKRKCFQRFNFFPAYSSIADWLLHSMRISLSLLFHFCFPNFHSNFFFVLYWATSDESNAISPSSQCSHTINNQMSVNWITFQGVETQLLLQHKIHCFPYWCKSQEIDSGRHLQKPITKKSMFV